MTKKHYSVLAPFIIRASSLIRHSSSVIRHIDSMITLGHYLIVSGVLFSIGFAGVMLRRNLIIILMSLELMLNAANLSLVAFSRFRVSAAGLTKYNGQGFVFFIITVDAAAVAVGVAILLAFF